MGSGMATWLATQPIRTVEVEGLVSDIPKARTNRRTDRNIRRLLDLLTGFWPTHPSLRGH
jgi:hypothetical protein